jgi:large-conductance mechanosensitive channel
MQHETKPERDKVPWLMWSGIFVVLATCGGFYWWKFWDTSLSDQTQDWGAFGSYFGEILSPVISAFALFFVFKTYGLQRKEMEGIREAQKEQTKIAAQTALLNYRVQQVLVCREKIAAIDQGIIAARANGQPVSVNGDDMSNEEAKRRISVLLATIRLETKNIAPIIEELESSCGIHRPSLEDTDE